MKKKYLRDVTLCFFAIGCLFFIFGCGGTSSGKKISTGPGATIDDLEAGRIQGTIFAQSNGNVIKGAVVETFQQQSITGDDGRYMLGPIPAGDYRLIARASGFSPVVKDDVRVYAGKITENTDYRLAEQTASYSPDFSVIALVPYLGTDGDIITVYCRGCGNEKGKVTFNDKEATIIDWNSQRDDRIIVQVPIEVETGPVRVIINGETSKETQPQLFIGKPVILKAEPQITQAGAIIHITGRNFNPVDRYNRVFQAGAACVVTSVVSDKKLQVQLPVNAKTGIISIRIDSIDYMLEGISNVVVTIKPELVHISPKRSVPDVPLTVYGKNFGDNKNNVKVLFGGFTIRSDKFLSFTDSKLSFKVPDNSVVAPDQTVAIKVQVNDAQSNSMTYTAYNTVNNTINDYGMYDFTTVSRSGTLHLPTLRPTDRIAFLSVLAGDSTQDLPGTFNYSYSGFLGGNFDLVPAIPGNIRTSARTLKPSIDSHNTFSPVSALSRRQTIRPSIIEPASATMQFYVRDFTAADPWDAANDKLATATLKASGTMTLVYLDQNATGITDDNTREIAGRFDKYYDTIATACWDRLTNPPEGNVDAQSRIALLLSPILEEANFSERLVAYFDPRDKDLGAVNTNGSEILFANPAGYRESRDDFYGGLVETLQFMMYYNQKEKYGEGSDWQKMGLSTFARQIVGLGFNQGNTRAINWVAQYLLYPETVSLNHWPVGATYSDFGMAFLFTQYLFDHCGGYDAISILERKTGTSGLDHLENYIVRPATGLGLAVFFHNFCKALYCDNLGLKDGFTNYDKVRHQFSGIKLRGNTSGIEGLRGISMGENPVTNRTAEIKGYGCSLIEYSQGNWGDLEVTVESTPTAGDFRTWVIYYSAEQIASGT